MPIRPCAEPGCPYPAKHGDSRCTEHYRQRERERGSRRRKDAARKPYKTTKWANTARHVRFEQPLCAECGRVAEDTDHITPIRDGGQPYSRANLQGLCKVCHGIKSAEE
jgi:5-methylcytosine-specific restriction protein A